MARLTPLSETRAREIGPGFGLDIVRVEALDLGSVNSNFSLWTRDGKRYFARIYEEQGVEGARGELRLLRELSAAGVALPLPLPYVAGDEVPLVQDKPLAVYHWQEGVHLCNRLVDEERTHRLGQALARVHLASPRLSAIPSGRFGVAGIADRLDAIQRDTERFDDVVELLRSKLTEYSMARDESLPSGLIHGDLFRDNVLWHGPELVGLLDFESASNGPFAYDLAVCILAWCYTDGVRLDCARALLDGYHAVRPLTPRERRGLVVEGSLACIRFATTRIRDFSMRCAPGATPVRDYRRFLQRLGDIEAGAFRTLVEAPQAGP